MILLGMLLAFVVVAAVLSSGAIGVFACRGVFSSLTEPFSTARMPPARALGGTRWRGLHHEALGLGRVVVRAAAGCIAGIIGLAAAYAWGLLCLAALSAVL